MLDLVIGLQFLFAIAVIGTQTVVFLVYGIWPDGDLAMLITAYDAQEHLRPFSALKLQTLIEHHDFFLKKDWGWEFRGAEIIGKWLADIHSVFVLLIGDIILMYAAIASSR